MTGNRQPFIGSGRLKEGGELTTRKQDFNAHWQGNGFRHTADNIDMNPPIPALGGTTVQTTLQDITSLISSSGTGFVSIGNAGADGYAFGSYNINTIATPTLRDAFNAAVQDKRLQNGGIILILAGTYTTSSTITIPSGITVIGEVGGTLIIGEMIEQPMFLIDQTVKNINVNGNSGGGPTPLNSGSIVEKTKFLNLMLADNLNGNVASGGASMSTVPMVSIKLGANFECQNVSFIGRLNNGSVSGRIKTLSAIDMITGGSTGSIVKFDSCFFDAMQIAINFNSVLGNADYLTVTNCRARTYGTETVSGTAATNTFISVNLCNLSIVNNYYVGAGTITNTFLNIGSTTGNTAVSIVVSGNSGSPTTVSLATLIKNSSGVTFTGMLSGNNWGTDVNSPWFITVGGSNTAEPLGDIFGPNAIDVVFRMANNGSQATIIVNPGIYNVVGTSSANNFSNLKFIGNKKGKNYPIFNLNLTDTTTDAIGNKFLVFGNHLESIQFATESGAISVTPTFNALSNTTQFPANTITVKDCLFTDVTLRLMDIGMGPFIDSIGNPAKLHVIIDNCDFRQTGSFTDNIGLVAPRANTVRVSNCNFSGSGYAMSLGTNSYSSASIQEAAYLITDTTFDLTGFTITNTPPTSISANYISITDFSSRVVFQNCQILNDSSFGNVPSINTSLTAAGTFTKFMYVGSRQYNMISCDVVGPTQTYTIAGTAYVMPSIFIEASASANITDTNFTGGALPLQFGGPNFTKTLGVLVQGCNFNGNSAPGQFTQIDIDFNLPSFGGIKTFIRIIDNIFEAQSVSDVQVQHTNATGAFYNAQGMVQIYANNYDVVFANNKVGTTIRTPTVNPYAHFAGVVINNYDSSVSSGSLVNNTTIHDNNISMVNTYTTALSGQSAVALWVKSSDIKIHDNYLAMNNTATPLFSFVGCAYIDNRPTVASPNYSDAMVTTNSFVRRTPSGAAGGNFVGGYVIIASTSGKGTITDNSFSDPTIDGSSTTVVLDQTSQPSKWRITQNKNQTESFDLRGNIGLISVASSAGSPVVTGVYDTNPVVVFTNAGAPNTTLTIEYTSSSFVNFFWSLPLFEFLPKNATIVKVSTTGQCDHTMSSASFSFTLTGTTPGSLSASPTFSFQTPYVANSNLTSTITPGNSSSSDTYVNTASESLTVLMQGLLIQNSTSATIKINPVTITYLW